MPTGFTRRIRAASNADDVLFSETKGETLQSTLYGCFDFINALFTPENAIILP